MKRKLLIFFSILTLTFGMLPGMQGVPSTAWAAEGDVCEIEGAGYATLDLALAAVGAGQTKTIRLLDNITHNKGIEVSGGQHITFDLNNYNLNVVTNSGIGLLVTSGYVDYASPGAFHVTGYSGGVNVIGVGAYAEVSSATATAENSGGVSAASGGDVVVNGNVQGGYVGAGASGSGSTIIVNGDVAGTLDSHAVGARVGAGGSVTINGGDARGVYHGAEANGTDARLIINSGDAIGTGENSHGIHVESGGYIEVKGDAEGGQYGADVSGTSSSAIITGNVRVIRTVNGWGLYANQWAMIKVGGNVVANGSSVGASSTYSEITIDGAILASNYIKVYEHEKGFADKDGSPGSRTLPTTKDGYYTYSTGSGINTSTVWVKESGPPSVCRIGTTEYASLDDALAAVGGGQTATIRLLQTIDYLEGIYISDGSNIIFDLNGFDLNVTNSSGEGLLVTNGSISYTGQGEFNITGNSFGVNVNKDPSASTASAVVTNATAFNPSGYGAYSSNGGSLIIRNNVTGGAVGAWAFTSGSSLVVLGDVTATTAMTGIGAQASANGKVTVDGRITADNYIRINTEIKDGSTGSRTVPTTKNGYYTYSTGGSISTVWVKVPSTDVWSSGSALTASQTTHNSTVLSWPAATGAVDYVVYKGNAFEGGSNGALAYTATALSPNTEYIFRVDAYRHDAGWIAGPSVLIETGSVPTGGGSGSSGVVHSRQEYKADVMKGNGKTASLSIVVDTGGSSAAVDLSAQADLMSDTIVVMPSIPGVTEFAMEIPGIYLAGSQEAGTLTFTTDRGSISIPGNMLNGISGVQGKTAEITISEGDKSRLTDAVKASVGSRPLLQLTLALDGKQTDWSNPAAPVTISVPYSPTATELADQESIVIWYIDGTGKPVCIPSGHYDATTGTVTFTTTHFSLYAVGYNKISFTDVSGAAWYSDAVTFLAARGITSGTTADTFSPGAKLTRGQFIVMLMKAYGIEPDATPTDNFDDAGSTYYTGFLAAAKRLGISQGVGGNLFEPKKEITRQEMVTLLYNVLETLDQLPGSTSGNSLSDFSDSSGIASWAKDAMELMVRTETISGSGGKLFPTSSTTRAEMAQVLYNLLIR